MCSPRRSAPSSPQVRADNAETARAKAEEELRAFQRPDYLVELQQALEASEQRAVDAQAAAATATAAAAAAEQSIAQLRAATQRDPPMPGGGSSGGPTPGPTPFSPLTPSMLRAAGAEVLDEERTALQQRQANLDERDANLDEREAAQAREAAE